MATEIYKNPEDLLLETKTEFANLIRNYRTDLQMTQEQFAEYCHLTSRAVQNYEAGRIPTPAKIRALFRDDTETCRKAIVLSNKAKSIKLSMKRDLYSPVQADGPHKIISPGLAVNLNSSAIYLGESDWLWSHVLDNLKEADRNIVIFTDRTFLNKYIDRKRVPEGFWDEFMDTLNNKYETHLVNIRFDNEYNNLRYNIFDKYPSMDAINDLMYSIYSITLDFATYNLPPHIESKTGKRYDRDGVARLVTKFITSYVAFKYLTCTDIFPTGLSFSIDDYEFINLEIESLQNFYKKTPECSKKNAKIYNIGKNYFDTSFDEIDSISSFNECIKHIKEDLIIHRTTTSLAAISFRIINRLFYMTAGEYDFDNNKIKDILTRNNQCLVFETSLSKYFYKQLLSTLNSKNEESSPIDFYFFDTDITGDAHDFALFRDIVHAIKNKNPVLSPENSYSFMLPPKQSLMGFFRAFSKKYEDFVTNEQVIIDGETKLEIIKLPGNDESIIRYV